MRNISRVPGVHVRAKDEAPPAEYMLRQVRDKVTRKTVFARVLFGFVSLTVCRFLILIYQAFSSVSTLRGIPGDSALAGQGLEGRLQVIDWLFTASAFFGLCITILLFIWLYYAVWNRNQINPENKRYSPTWAVVGFLIPVVNIFAPIFIMLDLWKGSTRQDPDKPPRKIVLGLVFACVWWIFLLLELVLNVHIANLRIIGDVLSSDLTPVIGLMGVTAMVGLIHGVCLLLIVAGIEKQQREAYRGKL